jgi:hypothetical protein
MIVNRFRSFAAGIINVGIIPILLCIVYFKVRCFDGHKEA